MKHPQGLPRSCALALLALAAPGLAGDVTLDGTSTPDGLPLRLDGPQFLLDEAQGLRRGDNLFHSLGTLVIDDAESLSLTGSATIDNVLLRVTGGDRAVINGQLSLLIDDANLFLLNPAGVIFGERASVDVPGSLVVSTGEALALADGSSFPASGPLTTLSTAPPAAWHDYGAPLSGEIVVDATLQVDAGAFLLADRITFNRGALIAGANPFLRVPPTPQQLTTTPGPVRLLANSAIEANGLPAPNLGTVNSFNWSGETAGTVSLTAPLVAFNAGALQTLALGAGNGADLIIEARDLMSMSGVNVFPSPMGSTERSAAIGVATRGAGTGGNLTVLAGRFTMTDGAAIVLADRANGPSGPNGNMYFQIGEGGMHLGPQALIAAYARAEVPPEGQGPTGGDIHVDVQGPLVMSGAIPDDAPLTGFNMGIVTKSLSSARAGDINIRAITLEVEDGGRIESGALRTGLSGNVMVEASQSVTVRGGNTLLNSLIGVLAANEGSVGSTRVVAPQIQILDGASIRADSLGSGGAGSLTLQAEHLRVAGTREPVDEVLFNEWVETLSEASTNPAVQGEGEGRLLQFQLAGAGATVASDAVDGEGGDLIIEVGTLDLEDGGVISATSLGDADGGDISIDAQRVQVSGEALIATDAGRPLDDGDEMGSSNAGQIQIAASESIRLSDGKVSSNSIGAGDAGSITLRAPQIDLSGAQAGVSTVADGSGAAGTIRLEGDDLSITGATLNAQSRGAGSGGNVQVQASESLSLVDATLTASSGAAGGGSLQVSFGAASPALISNSVLTADTQTGDEQAGSVVVQGVSTQSQLSTVVLDNAQLLANADGGAAGNVLVQAGTVLRDNDTLLAASNRAGLSGPVEVQEQSQNTQIDAAAEPPAPVDPSTQLGTCRSASTGSFWVRNEIIHESPATVLLAMGGQGASPVAIAFAARPVHPAIPEAQMLATRSVHSALAADDLVEAHRLAQRAIKLTKSPTTLATKAVVDYARADYLAAARSYEETARLARREEDPALLARAHANAARAWLLAARPSQALEQLRLAQDAASRLPADAERALLMLHVGQSWMSAAALNGPQAGWPRLSALTALRDAHATAKALGERTDLLAWSLGALSELYAIDGRTEDALNLAWRALAAGEHTPDAYRWYRQVARLQQDAGRLVEAGEFYERALTLSSRAAGSVRGSQTREAHFRRQIAPVYLEYAALLMARAEQAAASAEGQSLLLDAREVINRLHAAEIRDYLQEQCAPTAGADSRTIALANDTAVVFPIVFDDRVELLIQTASRMQRTSGEPLTRTELTVLTGDLRERLLDPRRSAKAQARALYDAVFAELDHALAQEHRIDRLIFVPDGPLRLIPLGALHDGDQWLAQRYVVEVMQRLAPTPPLPAPGRPGRLALLAGVSSFGDQEQPALPYVPEELEAIREAWHGRTAVLREEQFTRSSFFDALAEMRPRVLHVATHGTFTGSLERSYLVTGDGARLGIEELFLPLQQLAAQRQAVDLVVLSACDTAVGVERSSMGLAGIALRAGVGHAAGALWPVPDDGTAQLFRAFYRLLEEQAGDDPGRALALAQRQLISSERYAHPAYWAGFQIISNGVAWGRSSAPKVASVASP